MMDRYLNNFNHITNKNKKELKNPIIHSNWIVNITLSDKENGSYCKLTLKDCNKEILLVDNDTKMLRVSFFTENIYDNNFSIENKTIGMTTININKKNIINLKCNKENSEISKDFGECAYYNTDNKCLCIETNQNIQVRIHVHTSHDFINQIIFECNYDDFEEIFKSLFITKTTK